MLFVLIDTESVFIKPTTIIIVNTCNELVVMNDLVIAQIFIALRN